MSVHALLKLELQKRIHALFDEGLRLYLGLHEKMELQK